MIIRFKIQDNISDDKQAHNPVLGQVSMVLLDTRDASSSKNLSNPTVISLFWIKSTKSQAVMAVLSGCGARNATN